MTYIYYRPHVHVASYAIGIMLGYVVLNHSAEQLHRLIRITLWLLSTTLALLVVFGPFKWLRGDPWVGLDAVLYAGFNKAIWALLKDFFGCLTLSYLLAYLLFLLCEAPVASLEKILLAPTTRR
ncbi:unnamed protein product, partial [Ixodes hexagonus]